LRPFQQEFGIECVFDNQKVAAECDVMFICVLPSQAQEVFKDIRNVIIERVEASKKSKKLINPLIVCTCAAIGLQKLKLMLSDQAMFLKTNIDVSMLKEYLFKTQALRAKIAKEGG
jgi:pyrroline-5-carboxylate reductase